MRSSIEPEFADDGIDNDCSGTDLVALTATGGIFVDGSNVSCTDGAGAGSQSTPYCTLEPALTAAAPGGDVFVAAGTYSVTDLIVSSSSAVSVYGGYDGSWNRNLATNTTTIDTTGFVSRGLLVTADRAIIDGIRLLRTTGNASSGADLALQVFSLGSVTRSGVDVSSGTPEGLRMVGFNTIPSVNTAHALVRDVAYSMEAGRSAIDLDGFATMRVENSRFEFVNTPGVSFAIISEADREFVVNNTFLDDGSFSALTSSPDSGDSYVAHNSVYATGGGTAFQFRAGSAAVVNNLMFNSGTSSLMNSVTFTEPNVLPLTLLNNILDGPLLNFGILDTVPGPTFENLTTDTIANACVNCTAAGGNLDASPGFVDGAMGDFDLTASSAAVDAGVDPTATIPYFRVNEDIDGVARPLDGDGMGGAQWDVGAVER